MNILSVDTSSQSCSVGIVRNHEILAELTNNTGQTHSRHILTMVDMAIKLSRVEHEKIDAYAVTIGPGSFTGVRIGLSLVKGMALGSSKPIVGVSSLDALAYECGQTFENVCVLMDARRKEVYFSQYEKKNDVLTKVGKETVVSPQQALGKINCPCAFVGSGALLYKNLILENFGAQAFFPPFSAHMIRAANVAYLGLHQLKEKDSLQNLQPNLNIKPHYVRASDAELNKKKN